ncbi:MAG: hypothetical protein HUN04_26385 [Desulfobacter sp.]|nr:MAG: hypothetical protein HUN04_26385 [Desulfobacter sp.]
MVQNNDDIIELTDLVTDASSPEEDQEIIELTDMAPLDETEQGEADQPDFEALEIEGGGEDVEIGPEEELSLDGDAGTDETSETPVPAPAPDEQISGEDLSALKREDIEAALERVIEKKFSQTIETILFEVMEKVIQKEIVDIKAGLQKDLDDIGRS